MSGSGELYPVYLTLQSPLSPHLVILRIVLQVSCIVVHSRGYAEAEIEAVFAKYDLDGDRVLDEDEQRNMQADLEGQKVSIAETCFI